MLPFPSPGDVTNSGTEQASLALAGEFFTSKPPGNPLKIILCMCMYVYVYVYVCASWVFIGGTDAEAETPVLWPPYAKS